jgi:type IV pilus assembly protein PilM
MAKTTPDRKLRLACELSAETVVAARAHDAATVDTTSVRRLPAGKLVPNLTAVNVVDRDVVRQAVQDVLAAVGPRSRDVIAVLPDAACRVALLDFDSMPEKPSDAEAVVRFRLKKSLPFDVDRARVSYQVQPGMAKVTVVAAVVLTSVVEEYESLFRECGFSPGVVMPSMLAALGQVDGNVPTLVIKIDSLTSSVAIVNQGRLLLLRTLDSPEGSRVGGAHLAEDVYPSLVFFQDTYGTKVQKVLVAGLESLEELNAALEANTGLRAQELVSVLHVSAVGGASRPLLGGVVGALTG